jgi:hypothetical protein
MIKKVDAFDTAMLKRGKGVLVTTKTPKKSFHGLIVSSKLLALEIAFVDESVIDTMVITPSQLVDGEVTITLMVPFKDPAAETKEGGYGKS